MEEHRDTGSLTPDAGVAPKDSLRDLFSQEELMKLQNAEMLVVSENASENPVEKPDFNTGPGSCLRRYHSGRHIVSVPRPPCEEVSFHNILSPR